MKTTHRVLVFMPRAIPYWVKHAYGIRLPDAIPVVVTIPKG